MKYHDGRGLIVLSTSLGQAAQKHTQRAKTRDFAHDFDSFIDATAPHAVVWRSLRDDWTSGEDSS